MSLKSERVHVVRRAERQEAEQFVAILNPALLALTGSTGVVCRETRYGDTLFDVRAQVAPAVAEAIYRLICDRGLGREDVTEEAVRDYLKEGESHGGAKRVGPLPDR